MSFVPLLPQGIMREHCHELGDEHFLMAEQYWVKLTYSA